MTMLNPYIITGNFIVNMILSSILYAIIYKKQGHPPDSKNKEDSKNNAQIPSSLPGTPQTRSLALIAMALGPALLIILVVMDLFQVLNLMPIYLVIPLSLWVNVIGLVTMVGYYGWGVAVMYYNISYIPLTRPMNPSHQLANRGPYRWVRHPMYCAKGYVNLVVFLITGWWFALFTYVLWILLARPQMIAEEDALVTQFGEPYVQYRNQTGRLFPKIFSRSA